GHSSHLPHGAERMPSSHEETTWKQITFYLLTLAILIVCGILLYPFFSAIVGAIVLAVISQRPYDWLTSKIRHRSTAASIAVILVMLAVIVPGYFLAQNIGRQALTAISALRDDGTQQRFSEYIGGHPAIASRIEVIS